jgi:5-methyltetrahydrofolate--homocysteine methyltransferase
VTLAELLEQRPVLLADGATGTNLFAMGLTSGDPPEMWNEIHPERVRALHQGFVDAGADIILTNSFGANRRRLALHHLDARTAEIARLAAVRAREVADAAGRPVIVAGSVGPTGDLFAPLGPMTVEEATEVFAEQIGGLKAGGADVIWIETMSSIEEVTAAAAAARRHAMPYVTTASFDTAGRTMMGITPAAWIGATGAFETPPEASGANCGVGASDLLATILGMTEAAPDAVVVAKGNCGVPRTEGDKIVYTGTPEVMGDYARLAIDAGARIIGGCCGTTCTHLGAMRRAIDSHVRRPRPTVAEIVETLGPLTSPPPAATANPARGGRRRA